MKNIGARSGSAFEMTAGQRLIVQAPDGKQVSDLFACSAANVRETLSNGRTFDYEEKIRLSTGNTLWSNCSNRMLTIVEDTHRQHDFLLTPCSRETFKHFYPDQPEHKGCFGNLADALEVYDVRPDSIGTAFNIFMNVPIDPHTGELSVEPPTNSPHDRIVFRAEMDLIIGLTACSAYASNGGSFSSIAYDIEDA